MSKKVLNIKRKLLDERNVTEPMPDDLILFQEIIDDSNRNFNSQKKKEKNNSNSSGDLRIISVLKDKEVTIPIIDLIYEIAVGGKNPELLLTFLVDKK